MLKASAAPKITAYIKAAMSTAKIKTLDDGTFYAEIPACPGVWSNEKEKEACLETLQEVLEEWLIFKLRDNDPLPAINNIELNKFVKETWDR